MDPLSITAGVVGLLDVTWRVGSYLKDVHEAAGQVEGDIASLLSEIRNLESLNKSIKHLHETEIDSLPDNAKGLPERDYELWRITGSNLRDCHQTVKKLETVLDGIAGKHGNKVAGWKDVIRKGLRKVSKDGELNNMRLRISLNRQSLHISLTMLDLNYTKRGSDNVQKLGFQLHRQIAALQSRLPQEEACPAYDSLDSATNVVSSLRLNEHFDTPKRVSPIFTGRKSHLDELRKAFDFSHSSLESGSTLKRFVVFGLGGSGKTQFCCKFASDNRQRFWGVFTIDASSQETAQHSFETIARLCKIDANERAARSWLSSSDRPWLLLVDNADDPSLELEKYLPEGEHGLTIITTRNPAIKSYGTIGQGSYHFSKLDDTEASQLLLKAADHHEAPTPPIVKWAATITTALGCLPLALVHAGAAIKNKYCKWEGYLNYYETSWKMIRESQQLSRKGEGEKEMEEYMKVYSTYEILYRGLEAMEFQRFKDALQLLQLFSFFHHENIPFAILIAAVRNPRLEREAQTVEPTADETVGYWGSWSKYFHDLIVRKVENYVATRTRPVLPTFLQDADTSPPADDFNFRLRKALEELTRLSLITYHDASDSYSMHPLVHTWVRKRPQMIIGKQAIWCEAALTTVSRCILLPPLSDSVESHANLPRQVLPHLRAIEQRQQLIRIEFANNQKNVWRPWSRALNTSELHVQKAVQLAKASLVYAQNGCFDEAERHQRTVRDFVYKMRGPDHPRAMDITLALAGTLWLQSQSNEAADLQEQVLQGCLRTLGPEHPRTLKVMDALGVGRRQQGRLQESIDLHQKAIDGMRNRLPEIDPAIFHAQEHLGITLWYCYRFEEAIEHGEKAVSGLKELLGNEDLKTLIAMESLARSYRDRGTELLATNEDHGHKLLGMAQENMMFVLEQRTQQLGDKQPYTWLAQLHLGGIKGAKGELDEGERLISSLIPIASAHLGGYHLGVMAGKNELARILTKQERFTEAEEILLDISRPENYIKSSTPTGAHPDRCDALWSLVDCYYRQKKVHDGLRTCDELEAVILDIRRGRKTSGTSDRFWQRIQDRRAELEGFRNERLIEYSESDEDEKVD